MNPKYLILSVGLFLAVSASADDKSLTARVHKVSAEGLGEEIGTVEFSDSAQGLRITPQLKSLTVGSHGFHIHEKSSCEAALKEGKMSPAEAAGGHLDPESTGKHEGPVGGGHLGDLPALEVNTDGTATAAMVAPRLTLRQIQGRTLMVHEGGDNYSDTPKKLGGGGTRIACGVIK